MVNKSTNINKQTIASHFNSLNIIIIKITTLEIQVRISDRNKNVAELSYDLQNSPLIECVIFIHPNLTHKKLFSSVSVFILYFIIILLQKIYKYVTLFFNVVPKTNLLLKSAISIGCCKYNLLNRVQCHKDITY